MKLDHTERFIKSLEDAPPAIQKGVLQAVATVARKLAPSLLRAKKYDEARDIWQARVTRDWRFYFKIKEDTYYRIDIIPHPK